MGSLLRGPRSDAGALNKYEPYINTVAKKSPLAEDIPNNWEGLHLKFATLYNSVREARNTAMHEGAFARHLTTQSIEISIILENALMVNSTPPKTVCEFMVRNPVYAALWQPLSFIRQNMLANSFSYLPVWYQGARGKAQWRLVSDLAVARYLNDVPNKGELRTRLSSSLEDAIKSNAFKLTNTKTVKGDMEISKLLVKWKGLPICVTSKHSNDLIGILTPFDLL